MAAFSRFLGYFTVVARAGSIRKASEQLNISASAIDRQILLAERQLGASLFERLPNGLRLTAAGEILLGAAQRWTRDYESVRTLLDDLTGLRRGHVRFAVIDALAAGFLPALLRRLHTEHPAITTDIAVLENAQVGAAVAAGSAEFGLMFNPRSARDLAVRAHSEIPLGIVMRPDHPLAGRPQLHFGSCADYPLVAPGPPLALSVHVEALAAVTGVAPRPVVTCDNIQLIKSLVGQGVGISVLSWLDVAHEVEGGELAFVGLGHPANRPLTLALCVDPSRQLSVSARLLLDRIAIAMGASLSPAGSAGPRTPR